jgi:Rad3-related DNA helicase
MFDEKSQLAYEWASENGIEMVYPTNTKDELEQLWKRWQELSPQQKRLADQKSIELFGMDNASHYEILQLMYV